MSETLLNLEKTRHEREIKELANKLTKMGEDLFVIFGKEKLKFSEVDFFIRVVLPRLYQEKLNKAIMDKYVSDVLTEISLK